MNLTSVTVRYLVGLTFGLFGAAGCADTGKNGPTTRPMTADERQAAVLRDPMNYGGDTEKTDMTGGDLSTFDKKAFKRDVDSVFNP